MAGYSRVNPPQRTHDNNDDLSSHYSRPSIQNSPDWPSIELQSSGPSARTLNQSNGGTYRGDLSSLANFSSNGLDPSVRSSVSTANMSTLPLSNRRRPSAPSGSSRQKDRHLSLDKSEKSGRRRGGSSTQPSHSIRADKSPHHAGLPPSRSRPSHRKSTSQSRTPAPPLIITPETSRDSANGSSSNQPVYAPIAWTGAAEEYGHSRRRSHSRDPRDYVSPGGWVSAPTRVNELDAPGDYTNPNELHRHKYSMTPLPHEEQEVLVYPTVPPARSHRAPLIVEIPREETHGAKAPDRLPVPTPTYPTLRKRDHNPDKMPDEGSTIIIHPPMSGTPLHAPWQPLQHSFQGSQSFLPMSRQRPLPSHDSYSLDPRGREPTIIRVGHQSSINYNPSSTSMAARPMVDFDPIEANWKTTSGAAPHPSSFRKFFSLFRRDSPRKSPGKEKKATLTGGRSKSEWLD